MNQQHYEETTIARAMSGDAEAALEALRLCRIGLDSNNLSSNLRIHLSNVLWALDKAITENQTLSKHKKSSGSIRSDKLALIESALGITKPIGRPKDDLPSWQEPYAAIGIFLQTQLIKPTLIHTTLDLIRATSTLGKTGLDRKQTHLILKHYAPLKYLPREDLRMAASPLREASLTSPLDKNIADLISDFFAADL
jgi:hypothetical protein